MTERLTFRVDIEVPAAGSGNVHKARQVIDQPNTMVTLAVLIAPSTNSGTLYVGWIGTNGNPEHAAGVEITSGNDLAWISPIKGPDGNPEPFDLSTVWIAGDTDGDALIVVTW